jgi:hypothetical protein
VDYLVLYSEKWRLQTFLVLQRGDYKLLQSYKADTTNFCTEKVDTGREKSALNPQVESAPIAQTCADLIALHPEEDHPSGLTHRERFNAWKFRSDLYNHGPAYFQQFKTTLGLPESVDQIPTVKMRYAPAQSMDVNESTHSGNISAITDLMQQGGVGDETEYKKK